MARIAVEDKLKIFSEKAGDLPQKWLDAVVGGGVPMFWQESKSVQAWGQVLTDVNADMVIDVSPGSGILATACMMLGIPYLGMVSNATHLSWLTNVIDRASLKYIVQSGHVLYQDDLASLVKDLFADVLEDDDQQNEELKSDAEDDAQ